MEYADGVCGRGVRIAASEMECADGVCGRGVRTAGGAWSWVVCAAVSEPKKQ